MHDCAACRKLLELSKPKPIFPGLVYREEMDGEACMADGRDWGDVVVEYAEEQNEKIREHLEEHREHFEERGIRVG